MSDTRTNDSRPTADQFGAARDKAQRGYELSDKERGWIMGVMPEDFVPLVERYGLKAVLLSSMELRNAKTCEARCRLKLGLPIVEETKRPVGRPALSPEEREQRANARRLARRTTAVA